MPAMETIKNVRETASAFIGLDNNTKTEIRKDKRGRYLYQIARKINNMGYVCPDEYKGFRKNIDTYLENKNELKERGDEFKERNHDTTIRGLDYLRLARLKRFFRNSSDYGMNDLIEAMTLSDNIRKCFTNKDIMGDEENINKFKFVQGSIKAANDSINVFNDHFKKYFGMTTEQHYIYCKNNGFKASDDDEYASNEVWINIDVDGNVSGFTTKGRNSIAVLKISDNFKAPYFVMDKQFTSNQQLVYYDDYEDFEDFEDYEDYEIVDDCKRIKIGEYNKDDENYNVINDFVTKILAYQLRYCYDEQMENMLYECTECDIYYDYDCIEELSDMTHTALREFIKQNNESGKNVLGKNTEVQDKDEPWIWLNIERNVGNEDNPQIFTDKYLVVYDNEEHQWKAKESHIRSA